MANSYETMTEAKLREHLKSLEDLVTEPKNQVQWFMEQFKLAQRRQFGASGEKTDVLKD